MKPERKQRIIFIILLALGLGWCSHDGARASGVSGGVPATVQILTAHGDNTKQNWNAQERILTPAAVSGMSSGRVASLSISGYMFSQPIFVPSVTISGIKKDLVIAATMNNIVYAYDANNFTLAWSHSFGSLHAGTSSTLYSQEYGCLSSPAVDIATQKLYVVCGTAAPNWVLFVLNLGDGSQSAFVTIAAQVVGTGDPNGGDNISGSNLLFFPAQTFGRSSVTIANGNIYLCFGSSGDFRPYHGWVLEYAESDLSQIAVWCATPNNYGGAVWMSGGGAAVDASGNIYVVTGNGNYDGTSSFSDSVVKLSGTNLTLTNWFTPSNQASLETNDWDLSANRVYLLPNNQLLVAGKSNQIYVMSQSCMGHLQGSSGCALQAFPTSGSGSASSFIGTYGGAFGLGNIYLPTLGGPLYAYSYTAGTFNTVPVKTGSNVPYPGEDVSLSSNGAFGGIVWTLAPLSNAGTTSVSGVFMALDPVTLATLYTNNYGTYAKFASPLIANGHVFVSTNDGAILVFGVS